MARSLACAVAGRQEELEYRRQATVPGRLVVVGAGNELEAVIRAGHEAARAEDLVEGASERDERSVEPRGAAVEPEAEIGRASCRERVCYVV